MDVKESLDEESKVPMEGTKTTTAIDIPRDNEVGNMLDSMSSNSKFSFKEGFYSESEADLGRHRMERDEAEGYHRKEEFPHMRHLLALQGHHHKNRPRSSRSSADPTKSEIFVSPTSSQVEFPMSAAVSEPAMMPSNTETKNTETKNTDLSPEIVVHSTEDSHPEQSKKDETDGQEIVDLTNTDVHFFVGEEPAGSLQHQNSVDSAGVPSPKPSIIKAGSKIPSGDHVRFMLGSVSSLDDASGCSTPQIHGSPVKNTPSASSAATSSSTKSHHRHHHHHHHHHHKHVPSSAELAQRRHPGSETRMHNDKHKEKHKETFDDDITLPEVDLVGLESHRFDRVTGSRSGKKRAHSAMASVVQIGKPSTKSGSKPASSSNVHWKDAPLDHSPHDMFVELDELFVDEGEEYEWREKSRWIKFEEDVEEGADRWGKPHVASLSFHSLLELRKVIEQGVIQLDVEAEDLPSIADVIAAELVHTKQLTRDQSARLVKALLLKHRHVNERSNILRRNASYNNLQGLESGEHTPASYSRNQTSTSLSKTLSADALRAWFVKKTASSSYDIKKATDAENNKIETPDPIPSSASSATLKPSTILRRIPVGAEATTVLVGSVEFLDKPIMAFLRLAKGQYLGNLTEVPLPVRFLFLLMGPPDAILDYHEVGRSISTLMSNTHFHDMAYKAEERGDLLHAINEFLDDSLVLPPGEWGKETLLPIINMARRKAKQRKDKDKPEDTEELIEPPDDPLERTGRLFGGLVRDVKRRYPKYLSDLKDGLNMQCLAAFFFIYFACLSPAITFGGLLGEKTESWIGVSEVLLATSMGGIVFALFAGQPLNIMGVTGPILVFEEALYQICGQLELEYLPFRVWVGVWVSIITLLMVALDGSFLVRYFTRFTEEIFASLISLIFIYEVFKKLYVVFTKHPLMAAYYPADYIPLLSLGEHPNITLNNSIHELLDYYNLYPPLAPAGNDSSVEVESLHTLQQPNTALLSLILTFGTFFLAYFLKQFRNSKFLGRSARRAIGDFGIPISIIIMVAVDFLVEDTYTEKLFVPDGLKPTNETIRGWVVNPLGMKQALPIWAYFAAVIPAFLVFILIFMESQITSIIVNKKERKLKKGAGYHLDLLLIGGLFPIVCTVLGLPMLCAATVRSVAHVSALTVYSRTHAPGEKPKLLLTREQRVTSLLVHITIGVSVLMGPVLRQIPVAVLFGVFLYMGIASMSGIQLFERVELLFMPVKHHPDVGYVRHVRTWKMNLFTGMQLVCLALLWTIKSTEAALAFPFLLILMVPVRLHGLKYVFSSQELIMLDTAEETTTAAQIHQDVQNVDEEDELDFYQQAHMPL